MQTVSARFSTAVVNSHQIATKFLVTSGLVGGNAALGQVYPSDGSVTEDVKNAIRRAGSGTFTDVDGSLVSSGWLSPYGNELVVQRGITYSDGTTEMVPIGVYRITDAIITDTGSDLNISVSLSDRSYIVAAAKLSDYYVIAAGTDLGTAIKTFLIAVVPALANVSWAGFADTTTPIAFVTPQIIFSPGDDPWAQSQKMATSAGYDLYFDQNGNPILALVPNPATTDVSWTYDADDRLTSMLEQLTRKVTSQSVYNHIVVLAGNTNLAAPLRSDAYDTNPASPTYYRGSYGLVTDVINSTTITTQAQCDQAAQAALYVALGATASGSFSSIVNPAHLVNDVVGILRQRMGYTISNNLPQFAAMDAITIPFTAAGSLAATLRLVTR